MKRNVIGTRVHEARKHARPRLSQADLAARLQLQGLRVDQSAVSKIEHERRPVLDFEVVALAKALNVPLSWLLGETDSATDLSTKWNCDQ